MSYSHRFGGPWTDEKLNTLRDYLVQYRRIFDANAAAQFFNTIYVDAFAGTGSRTSRNGVDSDVVPDDEDAQSYRQGSVSIALDLPSPFDQYFLIDKNRKHVDELENMKKRYSNRNIAVAAGDANGVLQDWCARFDKRRDRAVVFLDPYGMQVEWPTIEAIASTQAIDMWLLFPLGQAVNRLLTRNEPPSPALATRLTRTFGTDEWQAAFYKNSAQPGLFEEPSLVKAVTMDGIAQFFLGRLRTVFTAVAPSYKELRNRKNVPIYILCFAAANPKGATPAIKIANHLLKS